MRKCWVALITLVYLILCMCHHVIPDMKIGTKQPTADFARNWLFLNVFFSMLFEFCTVAMDSVGANLTLIQGTLFVVLSPVDVHPLHDSMTIWTRLRRHMSLSMLSQIKDFCIAFPTFRLSPIMNCLTMFCETIRCSKNNLTLFTFVVILQLLPGTSDEIFSPFRASWAWCNTFTSPPASTAVAYSMNIGRI